MTNSKARNLKKGDKIQIDTFHFRSGRFKGVRKVVAVDEIGVQVRCFGWSNFYLKNSEIVSKL